jgi:predicted O-methyltransferase YrrM
MRLRTTPGFKQLEKIVSIVQFSLNLAMLRVLIHKTFERMVELKKDESGLAEYWARDNCVSLSEWLVTIDKELYIETTSVSNEIKARSNVKVKELLNLGIDLGGGGSIELLYFLTRKVMPKVILETGVAAGWSSYALLSAAKKNKNNAVLLSSDLPYFRIRKPEQYIGVLVPEELKGRHWKLEIKGDDLNLLKLISEETQLQLVHYDSDKRKLGREKFLNRISKSLDKDSIVVMDDIQNNLAFKEYVFRGNLPYVVIKSEEKFVGIIFYGVWSNLVPSQNLS